MTALTPAAHTQTVGDFLGLLAAKVPAPGGGATAALHLALAAALVSMVARYTSGARYAEHMETVELISVRADTFREHALQLIDDDMAAFNGVIASYKLPKATPQEAEARATAIAAAAAQAAAVPADVAYAAGQVLELADELFPIANRNVISDVAAAADAARAAATTARVNVEINLPSITDASLRTSLQKALGDVDDLTARADDITSRVREVLKA
jgi:formiminotetrahydrofolate cyclodeaminase